MISSDSMSMPSSESRNTLRLLSFAFPLINASCGDGVRGCAFLRNSAMSWINMRTTSAMTKFTATCRAHAQDRNAKSSGRMNFDALIDFVAPCYRCRLTVTCADLARMDWHSCFFQLCLSGTVLQALRHTENQRFLLSDGSFARHQARCTSLDA